MRTFSLADRPQSRNRVRARLSARCHDLRGELSGGRLEVVALCVGRGGYLERLGIRTREHDEIAWASVVRIEGDRIVVRDP